MRTAAWFSLVLAVAFGCGGGDGSGDGGDGDVDMDVDVDSDGDCVTGTDDDDLDGFVSRACGGGDCDDDDRAVHPGPDCSTLNLADLATAAEQTPGAITMEPMCETGDYEREIQNVVDDDDGQPVSWTELRTYHPPDKDIRHEIRTEYEVKSRCADGRIEELDADMHSLRPIFRQTCSGIYCFEGM